MPPARVLALGDALATDMRGAATAGIAGCWVLGVSIRKCWVEAGLRDVTLIMPLHARKSRPPDWTRLPAYPRCAGRDLIKYRSFRVLPFSSKGLIP
ncbi:HAD hydrolase-like protein [Komagataeibacter rhaeticus]|nr:HAD hydrolase-like protein [Komagataeibacter rhaeticus]